MPCVTMTTGRDFAQLHLAWILLVAVLETVSGGNTASDAGSSACISLPITGAGWTVEYQQHRHKSDPHSVTCTDPARQVSVTVTRIPTSNSTATASILACPSVERLQLRITRGKGHFVHAPPGVTVASCSETNDTAILTNGRHQTRVLLGVSVRRPLAEGLRMNYSYSQYGGRGGDGKLNVTLKAAASQRHLPVHPEIRRSRAVSDNLDSVMSSDNNTDYKSSLPALWSPSTCGKSQTCIRFGRDGCGHFECDYLLTYKVINLTHVDMEMSARSKGWLAVGFSSDRYMGGGDDVVGCKRKGLLSDEVVSMSMWNQGHSRPSIKANRLKLLAGRLENGHIYCRLMRPLKYTTRPDDSDLDLTNDWHQLYAFGDIDGNGLILQHTELPQVSQDKVTMLRPRDSRQAWNSASLPVARLLPVLLVQTLYFAVS